MRSIHSTICATAALVLFGLFAMGETLVASANEAKQAQSALAVALAAQDVDAINRAVLLHNRVIGEQQGMPEVADQFQSIPSQSRGLNADEAMRASSKMAAAIVQKRWWRIGLDPTTLERPLREPASVIIGSLALARIQLARGGDANIHINNAREAGDFLRWAQSQAGTGVFPFPAKQTRSSRAAFRAVPRALREAAARGETITRNGWMIDDLGEGGLQFDNGECGVAMLALYEATRDEHYLNAARQSADWALQRPLVSNWNYNSFSVYLLANAYRVTGNKDYLDSAIKKALLGVIPGQLVSGKYAGRWSDPHNARPTYHYIMMRSLAALLAVMPNTDADRARIVQSLRAGLIARNADFVDPRKGAPTKESAMHVLLAVVRNFSQDENFLRATQSREALEALSRLVLAQYRRGIEPMAPAEWGLFIEHISVGEHRRERDAAIGVTR